MFMLIYIFSCFPMIYYLMIIIGRLPNFLLSNWDTCLLVGGGGWNWNINNMVFITLLFYWVCVMYVMSLIKYLRGSATSKNFFFNFWSKLLYYYENSVQYEKIMKRAVKRNFLYSVTIIFYYFCSLKKFE